MRFLLMHSMGSDCTRDKIDAMLRMTQTDPHVKGYRGFMNLTEGRAVCVFDAPDRQSLINWLLDNNMDYDSLHEVELETEGGAIIEIPTCEPAEAGM